MIKITMLQLDNSLLFVAALVWALMIILNRVYFKPVGSMIDERERKIKEESAEIEEMTGQIEKKTAEIEGILREAKREAALIREELIRKGEDVREAMAVEAREQSKEIFSQKMVELQHEIAAAEAKLEKEVALFSDRIKKMFV